MSMQVTPGFLVLCPLLPKKKTLKVYLCLPMLFSAGFELFGSQLWTSLGSK